MAEKRSLASPGKWGKSGPPIPFFGHFHPHFRPEARSGSLRGPHIGGSQKGGFQKGGFGGCSPGTKTGTRVRSPKPPFWKPPFYLPMALFGVRKRVVSKRVVSADVPQERKPERGYVRQNHPFTKPPFYLPVNTGLQRKFLLLRGRFRERFFPAQGPCTVPNPRLFQTLFAIFTRKRCSVLFCALLRCFAFFVCMFLC